MSAQLQPRRLAEFLILFVLVPAALWGFRLAGRTIPVVPILCLLGLAALLHLGRTAPGHLRGSLVRPWSSNETRRISLQVSLGAVFILAYVLAFHPDRFLDMPLQRTSAWVLFLVVYPLLSVLPQELIFRAFFFHRYAGLLRTEVSRVLVSALVFGLAHAFYGTWTAVGLSTLGGLFFSWTFARTGSLPLVVLEHAVYGVLERALERYAQGAVADMLADSVDAIKHTLPTAQRRHVLNDLIQIANADGIFLDSEEDLLNDLTLAWDVDAFADEPDGEG